MKDNIGRYFTVVILFCLGILVVADPLLAPPGIIGNGGDLRILFRKAKIEAVNVVYKDSLYKDLSLRGTAFSEPLRKIFSDDTHMNRLADDILRKVHKLKPIT